LYIDRYFSHRLFSPEFVRFHFSEFCQNSEIFGTVYDNWKDPLVINPTIGFHRWQWYWWQCYFVDSMMVTVLKVAESLCYVSDILSPTSRTYHLHWPSPKSVTNIDVTLTEFGFFLFIGPNDIFRIFINVNQPNRMSCGIRSSVLTIMSTVNYKILSDKVID